MAPWFETLFDESYIAFYEELQDREVAAKDAEFVERALALPAEARLLDLGCGFGRHAVSLAMRGHRVTGLDLSRPLLRIARDLALLRIRTSWSFMGANATRAESLTFFWGGALGDLTYDRLCVRRCPRSILPECSQPQIGADCRSR